MDTFAVFPQGRNWTARLDARHGSWCREQLLVQPANEMAAELDRIGQKDSARAGEIAGRIKPVLAIQTSEMARKLVNTRIALSELGVT